MAGNTRLFLLFTLFPFKNGKNLSVFCLKQNPLPLCKGNFKYIFKYFGNIIKYILQFLQKRYNIKPGRPKGQNFFKEENEFGKTFCLCG